VSSKEWVEIIDQAVELGIQKFIISGGEPLFFHGVSEIIKKIESRGATFSLMTNLWEIDAGLLKVVLNSQAIKTLVTSLDGFEGHNMARPPSKWDSIIRNIRLFREQRNDIKININTVIHRHNLTEIDHLFEELVGIGINEWRLDVPIKPRDLNIMPDFSAVIQIAARLIMGRYDNSIRRKIELALFRVYKSQLENIKMETVIAKTDTSLHPCDYFLGTLAIKPDRTVRLCSPMQNKLGRVGENINLKEVLRSAEGNNFFDLKVNELENCKGCKYLLLCGGGCRADALRWTGDLLEADPISCIMMPLVEEKVIPILSSNLATVYKNLIENNGKPPKFISTGKEVTGYAQRSSL
jgi:radical SAM protein with 4Fe4S-binding SPASM domain